MITDICLYLKNWFDWNMPKFYGKFIIEDGEIKHSSEDMGILVGQYYRIIGSVFNDGVYKYGDESGELINEEFTGAVWLMAVPRDFLRLVHDIEDWELQYGSTTSVNMSPYQSESFGGYSYTKGGSGNSSDSSVPTWKSIFRDRLWRYKKI